MGHRQLLFSWRFSSVAFLLVALFRQQQTAILFQQLPVLHEFSRPWHAPCQLPLSSLRHLQQQS